MISPWIFWQIRLWIKKKSFTLLSFIPQFLEVKFIQCKSQMQFI